MSKFDEFFSKSDIDQTDSDDVADLIKRRRLQVIVHSCIYYRLNDNIVSDDQFDYWCRELVDLLEKHPGVYSDKYDEYFRDWDGSSGYHFPHGAPEITNKALQLIRYINENNLR